VRAWVFVGASGGASVRGLGDLIAMNAKAAGREAAHADLDDNDRLASAIHAANVEHGLSAYCGDERGCPFTRAEHVDLSIPHAFVEQPHDPQTDGPDVIDQGAMWFTTGYLAGRREG